MTSYLANLWNYLTGGGNTQQQQAEKEAEILEQLEFWNRADIAQFYTNGKQLIDVMIQIIGTASVFQNTTEYEQSIMEMTKWLDNLSKKRSLTTLRVASLFRYNAAVPIQQFVAHVIDLMQWLRHQIETLSATYNRAIQASNVTGIYPSLITPDVDLNLVARELKERNTLYQQFISKAVTFFGCQQEAATLTSSSHAPPTLLALVSRARELREEMKGLSMALVDNTLKNIQLLCEQAAQIAFLN